MIKYVVEFAAPVPAACNTWGTTVYPHAILEDAHQEACMIAERGFRTRVLEVKKTVVFSCEAKQKER